MSTPIPKPVVLLIISGWGLAAPSKGNALSLIPLPNFKRLAHEYQTFALEASGEALGLEADKATTSAIGHRCLGAGTIAPSELPRVNQALANGEFVSKKALLKISTDLKKFGGRLHLLGQISTGQKHSSWEHLQALLDWARSATTKDIFLHAIVDLTEDPAALEEILNQTQAELKKIGSRAAWGSITGQAYAMDRGGAWNKTQAVVDTLCSRQAAVPVHDWHELLSSAVTAGELPPRKLTAASELRAGDSLIFFNHRGDGLRQLARALAGKEFDQFPRPPVLKKITYTTLTTYDRTLAAAPIFTPAKARPGLGQIISQKFLKQLRLGDAGSYTHISEDFNGAREPWPAQENILVTDNERLKTLLGAIIDDRYDFISASFSRADLAADENDTDDLLRALEAADELLGVVAENVLAKKGVLLITSDHGNAEEFIDLQTGEIKRGNTLNPVPLIVVGSAWRQPSAKIDPNFDLSLLRPTGSLLDVAPTILKILQIRKPRHLEGSSLI